MYFIGQFGLRKNYQCKGIKKWFLVKSKKIKEIWKKMEIIY